MINSMKTNKLSLKTAIIAIAGVAALISIIYVAYLSNRGFEKTVVSQTQHELSTIADTIATSLEVFFVEHSKALKVISNDPLFQKDIYEKKKCDVSENIFCPIKNLYNANIEDVDALTLLDANGIMLHREPFIGNRTGMDHTDKPGVAYVIREHKPHVSEVFYNNLGNLAISIMQPIFYKDEFAGIARWMIETDTLSRRFIEPIRIGKNGFVWMFDNKDTVLSHPRKGFTGITVLDVIKKMQKERGEVFDESRTEEHIIKEHDYVNRVKAAEEGCGIFINCVTDEYDIIAYKKVAAGNLILNLIVTLPYSEITGPINKHSREIFGLAGFVIMLLGAGGLVLFRSQKEKARLIAEAKYLKQISNGTEALRKSEERYREFVEGTDDLIIRVDINGLLIYVNKTSEKIFGLSPEECIGLSAFDFIHPDDLEKTKNAFTAWLRDNKKSVTFENRLVSRTGQVHHMHWTINLHYDKEGNATSINSIASDLTDLKHIEAKIQQTQKMEAIANLAGGIAHEFNNALVGIFGNIELLRMQLPDEKKLDKYVQPMKDSAHRMAGLTKQLLAYARGGKYNPQTLPLNNFIEASLPVIKHNIKPFIRIETDLPGDISNIEVDLAQIQMVLSAVLINASESMGESGRIIITTRNEEIDENFAKTNPDLKPGPYVCIIIKDEGKGMDKKTVRRVFDPFFTTKFQGRGLGMAAAYGVVRNHGGTISLYSELDKGTVVRIYLPAVEIQAEQAKDTKAEVAIGNKTILVIEDEDVVMDVIRPMLEGLGCHVLPAKTGSEAIEIARTFEGDIDLAILDIVLPDMGGENLYPLIMEALPNLKVIVCSGYALDGPAQKILDAGAQDFIQKPFSLNILLEKLKKTINDA
jgi:two-component system cell cycle sensor histidine kinase/response regulator CckA